MEAILSEIQIEILKYALKKGFLTVYDLSMFYSTEKFGRNALLRFAQLGLIKDAGIRFEINRPKIEQILSK